VTPLPVVVNRSADAAIREASLWWVQNRPSAPSAFAEDLERALALISVQPEIGARALNTPLPGVRRVLMARIRYHLYYRLSPSGAQIEILALWHTSRGAGPVAIPE
jgi:plasmid stabilization system protein ParE